LRLTTIFRRVALSVGLVGLTLSYAPTLRHIDAQSNSVDELLGLWKSQHNYGPDTRGALVIERTSRGWFADFKGRQIPMREHRGVLTFEMPNSEGGFRARTRKRGTLTGGQWFQSGIVNPPFATNIVLTRTGSQRWTGTVLPLEDRFTLYLLVKRGSDGSVSAFIRNPQRNIGVDYQITQLLREGDNVKFMGRRRGENGESTLLQGTFSQSNSILSLAFNPPLDGVYNFTRAGDESDFYPRGKNPPGYVYTAPPNLDDGWSSGTLEAANIDRKGMESFIQSIIGMQMDSLDAMQVDAILIARHGKLVLEEYFHGFDRNTPHSTRSAGKSLTSVLVGAAMQAKYPIGLSSRVFEVMNRGSFPQGIESRKREMTLETLLTMTSGFFCDDGNPEAPGNEEAILAQTAEPDWYRFYMGVPLDSRPGVNAVYCSGDANLVIGVLQAATGEHPMDLFDRLIGGPMQIHYHGWYLSPSQQPYGGGSINMTPRNYMKFGQLMLNKGTWNGRRILSVDFVRRASAPLNDLNNIKYGFLWWGIDWPYKDRTVHAFFAGGNGGQGIIVIPELDLVIATFGSSYRTPVGLEIQQGLTPRYILPTLREAGDRKNLPVVPRDYKVIYGRTPRRN
jgi:CubicO group peptidase (beta-lactamase class C family)